MNLFLGELRRIWVLLRRYPMEMVSGLLVLTITFYALVAGAHYMAGSATQFGDRLDSIILGYWLWTLSIFALTNTARSIQTESMVGTLEQVYLSPYGPLRIFLARAAANLGLDFAISLVLLVVMLQLTGRQLSFPAALLLPLIPVVLAAYGLGLGMGGLALIFKQVGRVINLVQFLLLFLVVVPVETWEASDRAAGYLIPIAPAAGLLRDLMARGLDLDRPRLLLALANGLGYFVLGIVLFALSDRAARRRGLLGQY